MRLRSKDVAKLIVWLGSVLLPASQSSSQTLTPLKVPDVYAQTAWPSLHRDSRNSDFAPFFMPARHRFSWSRLDGAAVLPAPVIGPEGHLYVTTGRGPGASHLHAFDRSGNLLWESAPQRSMADLDSAACFSAPLIDVAGDLYLGDRDQLWAFHADGRVKWSVPISGGGPFASLAFTKEGFVLGTSAHGAVLVFRREDGGLAAPPLDLPGGAGPAALTPPPGLWANGLLDPAIASDIFNLFFGRVFEAANTPAVDPNTGRIYVTAAGPAPAEGALYGIDVAQGSLSIAFATPMGPASGTSPAISLDGKRVYATDGAGRLRAFDASTGAPLWSTSGPRAASPTIGPDDTVYAGGSRLRAINPFTGKVKWSLGLDSLAAAVLPVLPAAPPAFLTGVPAGRTNSVIAASATRLHVAVTLGYEYREPVSHARLIQPRVNLLLTINQSNGAMLGAVGLRDTNDGIISLSADGRLYSSHAALLSSIFYFGVNQTLPPALQASRPPRGGFSAFDPVWRR